ncbi:hypothetical protein ACGFNY_43905 [Streptomyces chartreusis]|uniref:hypothetical protein n=1 Tax=Streptomyces chartreusis TaxID=1969 RepID=UPI0037241F94
MASTSEHITNALRALTPRDGMGGRITPGQATVAIAHAEIAKAKAFERIATALETLAAAETSTPAGATLQPTIRHSV